MAAFAWWDRRTSVRPDRYVAISQYVARRIALYYNRQSTLVYPPVDTEFFLPHTAAAAPPPASERTFLIVSALVPYKRVDLAMMAARHAGVRLTVVGDGPERRLESSAPAGVAFLGAVLDTAELLATADAFVLPSEAEGLSNALLEAMASELACVVTDSEGMLDVVRPDDTAVVVPIGDIKALGAALARVATDEPLRQRLGRAARADVETRFSIDSTVRQFAALYDRLSGEQR